MSIRSCFARLATRIVAVAVFAWAGSSARAADVTAPVPVTVGAPVTIGAPGCETCQHGTPKGSCSTCGKSILFPNKNKKPYPVTLAPGACFGYFQTQWRKWDDACPYPYQGHGVSDAPKPAVMTPPRTGEELNPPRPIDPKGTGTEPKGSDAEPKTGTKKPGELPPIPPVPGSKFSP